MVAFLISKHYLNLYHPPNCDSCNLPAAKAAGTSVIPEISRHLKQQTSKLPNITPFSTSVHQYINTSIYQYISKSVTFAKFLCDRINEKV